MSFSGSTIGQQHRLLVQIARAHEVLDEALQVPTWSMTAAEHAAALRELTRLQARVTALTLAEASAAQTAGVGAEAGHSGAAAWWAVQTRQTRPRAHRLVKLAGRLDSDRAAVGQALASGEILLDQAEVIVDAVDALPSDLPPAIITQAEAHLLDKAAGHDATALRILGKRILDVVAPEIGALSLIEPEERQRRGVEIR